MNPSTINATTFTVAPGVMGTVTHDTTNTIFTFTPSSNLASGTVYTATITTGATDTFGNALAANFVWTFTTSASGCQPAPTVSSVFPAKGAMGVCPNTIVTATFSEAMNPASIDGPTFTVTGPGTTPVAGVVTYDASSDTAIFTPSASLAINTLFTATITTGAQNMFGTPLAGAFVWTFTTAAKLCLPPAPPTSVIPPNGSTGICPSTVVGVTFPQAMDPTTINTTTFTLTGPGTTPVTGTVTHDGSNKIFTFTPKSNLALNTLYTATITTGAKDPSGNALASNFVWTFTTSITACTGPPPPAVISVSPPNGAIGACPNAIITATFNEAMNPATIISPATTFTVAPGVIGTVTMDGTGRIAAFAPSSSLALNTLFTGKT
jgi:hypothetical protein